MKIKDVNSSANNLDFLKVADIENMFDVYQDADGRYFFNLNETIYLDIPQGMLEQHIVSYKSQWPLISYNIYGTTRFAWLLMKINNIDASKMFDPVLPGQKVLYVSADTAKSVVRSINGF